MYLAKGGEMGVYLLFENHYIIITTESQKTIGRSTENPSIKQHKTWSYIYFDKKLNKMQLETSITLGTYHWFSYIKYNSKIDRSRKMHLAILFLGKILSINITPWNSLIGVNGQGFISNLNWKSIFKIKQTHLTNFFEFTACFENLCFLVPCITA